MREMVKGGRRVMRDEKESRRFGELEKRGLGILDDTKHQVTSTQ